jgi:hypothetical protein
MSQVRTAQITPPKPKSLPRKQPAAAASPSDLMEETRNYLVHRAVRGSTAQGMKAIRRYLRDFVDWCQDREILRVSQITPDVLESYLHFLHAYRKKDGEPLLVNSRLAKLVPVRGWCAWLVRQGKLPAIRRRRWICREPTACCRACCSACKTWNRCWPCLT